MLYFNDNVPLSALTEEGGTMEAADFLQAWKVGSDCRQGHRVDGSGLVRCYLMSAVSAGMLLSHMGTECRHLQPACRGLSWPSGGAVVKGRLPVLAQIVAAGP